MVTVLGNIPDELKVKNQWVCVARDSKVPMNPITNRPASSSDPATWVSFQDAVRGITFGNYASIGFVFNDDYVGIDIDDGYDEYGFITPLAADLISKCMSYTEQSRSGRGFHIIMRGDLPFNGRNNQHGVEIYKSKRYFIMTGEVFMYRLICDRTPMINRIVNEYFPESTRVKNGKIERLKMYSPRWTKPQNRIPIRPIYPPIPTGCRNTCLTSLAGMLWNIGYEPERIYEELKKVNMVACDSPLSDWELETITKSVMRYRRG